MDTLSFLQKILPSQGVYVLAAFRNGMDRSPAHYNCKTLEDLARLARKVDDAGVQVFHACASFAEERKVPTKADPSKLRNATRAADNVAFTRSQWLDVDVGPTKDYPTRKEAVQAVAELCRTLRIPAPMFVASGRGLHCYWPFTKDLPAKQAGIIGKSFHAALKAVGFKHDTSRTADLASILRPTGTHWRKDGEVEVVLLRDAEPIPAKRFMAALVKYIPTEVTKPKVDTSVFDEWGTGPKVYPPSSAERIIKFCPTLRYVAEERGNVEEPLWRAMLGLVKHTVEGEAQAHAWSQGHPEYDAEATQTKIDAWTSGPTTCENFAGLCERCEGCKYADRKSPIHLGYSEELPPVAKEPEPVVEAPPIITAPEVEAVTNHDPEQYKAKLPDHVPFWPKGYAWDGQFLKVAKKDEEGALTWVNFSNTYVYPYMRFRQEDGTFAIRLSMKVDDKRWREIEVPSKAVAETQALANALGAYEIYTIGKQGREHMKQFMQDAISAARAHSVETVTYSSFGWHDDGFVLGNKKVTGRGVEPAMLNLPPNLSGDFGVRGTAQEWVEKIDAIYNRPNAEPYQFLICAAFGAPLVALAESDMWHGIPIALTGDSGLGKTTTCKVAVSMYGGADNLSVTASENGSTMNALLKRVAIARNLPFVMDEMTGRNSKELQDMLFALSNGKPKGRLRGDGSFIADDLNWDTITFITGNMNITALLSELDRQKAQATQMRCFEIMLADDFNTKVFGGADAKEQIEDILRENYGVVGREYLRFVLRNKRSISERLQKMRAKHNPLNQDETRERFYHDVVITAMLGGAIAQKLGFIRFDLQAIQKWANRHIIALRDWRTAANYTAEDYLQQMLSDMQSRIVTTRWFRDARTGRYTEMVDANRVRNPVARMATEDRRFLIASKAVSDWCAENRVASAWFKSELDKKGYIVHSLLTGDKRPAPVNLFRGTNLPGAAVRYIELDYGRVSSLDNRANLRVVEPESQEPEAQSQ